MTGIDIYEKKGLPGPGRFFGVRIVINDFPVTAIELGPEKVTTPDKDIAWPELLELNEEQMRRLASWLQNWGLRPDLEADVAHLMKGKKRLQDEMKAAEAHMLKAAESLGYVGEDY